MDSNEDMYESEEEEEYMYDSEEGDYGSEEEENNETEAKNKFNILCQEDICQIQQQGIARVCSILFVSQDEAVKLLLHFEWSVQRVIDQWLVNEEKLRKDLGLLERPVSPSVMDIDSKSELQCSICTKTWFIHGGMKAGICGHYYCNECWRHWIEVCIDDAGAGCLRLKCLEPSCNCFIGRDMVFSSLDGDYVTKYTGYLVRSYVESNRNIKWCPAPGCGYALELLNCGSGSSGSCEVKCKCLYEFCWNCSEEVHRPVDCETVKKWVLKNNDNEETENWKLFNTKACPKCKHAIEKNQGCMHMTCKCTYEFCWSCLVPWKRHIPCNGFETVFPWDDTPIERENLQNESANETEKLQQEKERLENLRNSHIRYLHYFGRWADNASSLNKALSDLEHIQKVQLEKLVLMQVYLTDNEVKFVKDAWLQIVECRRILKWTYAYGYFLPQDEKAKSEVVLFEHLQAYAESSLERLHQCAEQEVDGFLSKARLPEDFNHFSKELDGLTKATHLYFENLVQALENGLGNVNGTLPKSGSIFGKKFGNVVANICDV